MFMRAAVAAGLAGLAILSPAASPAQAPPRPAPTQAVAATPTRPLAAAPVAHTIVNVAPLPPAELEAFVDGLVRDAMTADHIPGVTISVVQNGQVILKKGYGYASLTPARPVDPDRSLFRIASISKTFTWIAVMRQVEAGRMRLDAPINLYLPERVQVRDQGFEKPVRMLDLMSHSPGFEDRALGQLFERDPDRIRPLLVYLKQERPRRVREPGAAPAYSNYGAALAGAAVSWVAQKPFERVIESEITGPLGMTRTTFRDPYPARPDLPAPMSAALAHDLADGYFWTGTGWRERPHEFTAQNAPAGGASTTAGDMARYMTMILDGGTLNGVSLYGPVTAAGFRTAQSRPASGVAGVAHGFLERQLPGRRGGWGHDGALLSFRSDMTLVPDLGLGVFIAANTESGERLTSQITARIVERFYGPAAPAPQPGSKWLKANARAFEGQYVSTRRAYGGLEKFIGLINGRVTVRVDSAGRLLVIGRQSTSIWRPDGGEGRFREVGGWRSMAFQMKDGRAIGFFPSSGVQLFQRTGFLGGQGWLVNLAILTAIAALATLGGLLPRHHKDHRQTPTQKRASLLQTIQAALWLLVLCAFANWASKAGDVAAIFFDWPGGWLLTASACALVASMLGVITLAMTPFIFRGGRRVDSWSTLRKLGFTATALIFSAFSLILLMRGALFPWAN